jgi:hypothetical protein
MAGMAQNETLRKKDLRDLFLVELKRIFVSKLVENDG